MGQTFSLIVNSPTSGSVWRQETVCVPAWVTLSTPWSAVTSNLVFSIRWTSFPCFSGASRGWATSTMDPSAARIWDPLQRSWPLMKPPSAALTIASLMKQRPAVPIDMPEAAVMSVHSSHELSGCETSSVSQLFRISRIREWAAATIFFNLNSFFFKVAAIATSLPASEFFFQTLPVVGQLLQLHVRLIMQWLWIILLHSNTIVTQTEAPLLKTHLSWVCLQERSFGLSYDSRVTWICLQDKNFRCKRTRSRAEETIWGFKCHLYCLEGKPKKAMILPNVLYVSCTVSLQQQQYQMLFSLWYIMEDMMGKKMFHMLRTHIS